MAYMDELTNRFNALDSAVRDLLIRLGSAADDLQTEINTLVSDRMVENPKLARLASAVAQVWSAIDAFGEAAPVDVPVEPTVGAAPFDSSVPVVQPPAEEADPEDAEDPEASSEDSEESVE